MRSLAHALTACTLALASCTDDPAGIPVDPADLDGDGVPNETDGCPRTRDPAQHDEDADGIGDACDNCPAWANPRQEDTTELAARLFADGVGDACDRRSTVNDDKLAAFHAFATPAEAADWVGAGWTIADDRTTGTEATWRAVASARGDGLTLQIHIASLGWPSTQGEFSVALDGDGVTSGMSCALVRSADTTELVVSQPGGSRASIPVTMTEGARFVLTITRAFTLMPTGTVACFLRVADGPEQQVDIPTLDDLAIGTFGMSTRAAEVAITSATVYTTPFACDMRSGGTRPACPRPP